MSSTPHTSPGPVGLPPRVAATIADQKGKPQFELSVGTESILLLDNGSLNRWASIGIVDRHNVVVASDGITIDGRQIRYADPRACELLESVLNRPASHPPASRPTSARGAPAAGPRDTPRPAGESYRFGDRLRVSRDGFEFHVSFLTRFGETKTEKLENALEAFQNMRAFKPHINLQKSGIRLVVTRWDGDTFVEQSGIENLEHASPEEVESLIRSNLVGGPESAVSISEGHKSQHGPGVVRIELVRKPHDFRFHLRLHRQDGSAEDGPVLIRPNLAKLAQTRIFRPDVILSMGPLSDRLTVEHKAGKSSEGRIETFPLATIEDAARLEVALNSCLRSADSPWHDAAPLSAEDERSFPESAPPPSLVVDTAEGGQPAVGAESVTAAAAVVTAPPEASVTASPHSPGKELRPTAKTDTLIEEWCQNLFRAVGTRPVESINSEIFAALHERYDRPVSNNDHGFPAFTLERASAEGPWAMEFVLAPHYLLCTVPFGYLRFGAEARVFLARLGDFAAFPGSALRGVAEPLVPGVPGFVVSQEFWHFLQAHHESNYRARFATLLTSVAELSPAQHLIWPVSREERIFQLTAATARSYGLPVTIDTIVLTPGGAEFIGFKETPPNGIEFRDGEDYARFTPVEVIVSEDGTMERFLASNVLVGWALDKEGRVCAIYRAGSGFEPPSSLKLLRFIADDCVPTDTAAYTILAMLEA